jgi:hypothetical protein
MTAGQKPPSPAVVSEAQQKSDAQQRAAAEAQRRARQARDSTPSFFNNPTQLFRGFGRW